jgi:2-isopropylmalate synthase
MTQPAAPRRRVRIYDTTLRDGAQSEGISYSLADKLRIARKLDEFGMDYVEGGWPGSNPKDVEFFQTMAREPLRRARLAAFGSTRRPHRRAEDDEVLGDLVRASTQVITIFGKTWDFHVTHALKVSLAENLAMIGDSVAFLRRHAPEVIFDAEHFFDGFKANPEYAIRCLKVAEENGAACVVLCDTNGGTLPDEIAAATSAARNALSVSVGIHAHDDAGCGVANSLVAVGAGADHVQGTINGFGERCGNANLCAVIPGLALKMHCDVLSEEALPHLTALSQFVDEVANVPSNPRQPYVGRSAFAHKAGVHVDAMSKHRATYEHVPPACVGNSRRLLVSELSGGATVAGKAAMRSMQMDKRSPEARHLLKRVADLEREGYAFEGAEASFELLMMDTNGELIRPFEILGFRVIVEKRGAGEPTTEATVKLRVNGVERLTVAEGDGPVHALDQALRKALNRFYPDLADIRLTDFKVRVVNLREGTAARVRTIVESRDSTRSWATVGVSTNMIEASWHALVDGVVYGLLSRSRAEASELRTEG